MPDIENSGKNSRVGKVPEKQPKNSQNRQSSYFSATFRLFSGCLPAVFPALCPKPAPLFLQLFSGFSQCQAFGTSLDARRDCKTSHPNQGKVRLQSCDSSDHLQESLSHPGPKRLQKSLLRGLQKSPRTYPKKSKNTPQKSNIWVFGDFFGYFR